MSRIFPCLFIVLVLILNGCATLPPLPMAPVAFNDYSKIKPKHINRLNKLLFNRGYNQGVHRGDEGIIYDLGKNKLPIGRFRVQNVFPNRAEAKIKHLFRNKYALLIAEIKDADRSLRCYVIDCRY